MPPCPVRIPSVMENRGRAIIREGPGPIALRERRPGEQTWRRSPARNGLIQTRRPDGVKAARELRNPLDTGTVESYPGPPQAGGSRAHGCDDNDVQAYDQRRVGLAGHHPGRDRLAAGRQVFERGRRERRTGGQGRARGRLDQEPRLEPAVDLGDLEGADLARSCVEVLAFPLNPLASPNAEYR